MMMAMIDGGGHDSHGRLSIAEIPDENPGVSAFGVAPALRETAQNFGKT
jgi:hypothetical protein